MDDQSLAQQGFDEPAGLKQRRIVPIIESMERHKLYVTEHGENMPQVKNWRWTS
jgi:xylulose-5-phosphate/fructose-6-phosphate phosphoketolase